MSFTLTSDVGSLGFGLNLQTVTLPTVNAGDVIRVWGTDGNDPGVNAYTVSDPTNGTYTKQLGLWDSGHSQGVQQFFFKNAAASTNLVIKLSVASSAGAQALYAEAWSGADTGTGFDKEEGRIQTNPGTGTDAISSSAAGTATTQADLILGGSMSDTHVPSLVSGTSFTTNTNGDRNATMQSLFERLTQGASGAARSTFTDATAGVVDTYLTMMMAVLPAAAGGGIPFARRQSRPGRCI